MIKDIIVNLSVGKPRDVAGDYRDLGRLGVRRAFVGRRLRLRAGDRRNGLLPVAAASVIGSLPRRKPGAKRIAQRKTFDENARRAGLSSDSFVISATASGAARQVRRARARLRSFDRGTGQPDYDIAESLAIEGALFGSGRPVLVVPYIQSIGPEARSRDGLLGRQPKCRARRRRRDAASAACRRRSMS